MQQKQLGLAPPRGAGNDQYHEVNWRCLPPTKHKIVLTLTHVVLTYSNLLEVGHRFKLDPRFGAITGLKQELSTSVVVVDGGLEAASSGKATK